MKYLWNSALGLLLVTGGLLGLTLPFGKVATEGGIPAILWALVISSGAGGVLLIALLARGRRIALTARRLRYFVIAAAISYAIPNLLMFSAIPHLGAGYTGIMFTLSPVITLVLSILLGVRRPNLLGVAGIAVGFVGAVVVATTRGEAGQPAGLFWVMIGLLIPVSLAAGNIYRTFDWPQDTGPIELAVGAISLPPRCCSPACLYCTPRPRSACSPACRCWCSPRSPRHRRCSYSFSGCRKSADRSISARSAMSGRPSVSSPALWCLANATSC